MRSGDSVLIVDRVASRCTPAPRGSMSLGLGAEDISGTLVLAGSLSVAGSDSCGSGDAGS